MSVRTIYSNNGFGDPLIRGIDPDRALNKHGSSIAFGRSSTGLYGISIASTQTGAAMAVLDRSELCLIYEALGRELADG